MKYLLASIFLFLSITSFGQHSKAEKKQARYQAVLDLIETEQFEYTANAANPQRAPRIDLTTNPNYLRVDKGKAAAEIPYFGRSFSGGYSSSDGGIRFDNEFDSYEVDKNDKKRRVMIRFSIKGEDDSYRCTLSIASLESATLSVISNKKQTISYTGRIRALKIE